MVELWYTSFIQFPMYDIYDIYILGQTRVVIMELSEAGGNKSKSTGCQYAIFRHIF